MLSTNVPFPSYGDGVNIFGCGGKRTRRNALMTVSLPIDNYTATVLCVPHQGGTSPSSHVLTMKMEERSVFQFLRLGVINTYCTVPY
jgi:hypothetical protein